MIWLFINSARLANPNAKPAENLDTSGIPIFDPVWLASIIIETCINAFLLWSRFAIEDYK
jgi:hypothetical protein